MQNNIFAHTFPSVNYPAYVSVNTDDGSVVEVIVRSEANPDGSCGSTSTIKLNAKTFRALVHRLFIYECTGAA